MEAQDSYGSLFEDKSKYDAVMSALSGVIYRKCVLKRLWITGKLREMSKCKW